MTCTFDYEMANYMARGHGSGRARGETFRLPSFCVFDPNDDRDEWDRSWHCTNRASWKVLDDGEVTQRLCGYHARIWNWLNPIFRDLPVARIIEIIGPRATAMTEEP